MKTLPAAACAAALLALSVPAAAQSYNPSGNYTAPGAGTVGFEAKKKSGPCPDPWVTMAQEVVYGSARADRCSPALYNGGRWGSYNELVHSMAKVKAGGSKAAQPAGPTIDVTLVKYQDAGNRTNLFSNNGIALGFLQAGRITVSLPPNIVGNAGGNMVAAGGGNMVAAGGGNLVANVERALAQNPPVAPMSGRSLMGVTRLNDLKAVKK
jgi:hypothetical protein